MKIKLLAFDLIIGVSTVIESCLESYDLNVNIPKWIIIIYVGSKPRDQFWGSPRNLPPTL